MKIDTAYVINLERRKDRRESFEKTWKNISFDINHFDAIDRKNLKFDQINYNNNDIFHNLGSIACSLSHIQVLERAFYSNQDNVLILEDDAVPCDNFEHLLQKVLEDLPENYMLCYLGGTNMIEPEFITNNIAKVKNTKSTVAYIINKQFIPTLISSAKNNILSHVVDEVLVELQKKVELYISTPRLIHQSAGYSDIVEQEVNYSWMKD